MKISNQNVQKMTVEDRKRTEKDKKQKQDYIDKRVAMFADNLLVEHQEGNSQDNSDEFSGISRHNNYKKKQSTWDTDIGY